MRRHIDVDPACHAVRWVSYLDLLGFTELVGRKDWIYVFSHYTQAVEHFVEERGFEPTIEKTWFSDTFLLYSPDNTASSFASIEETTRWFIYFLICAGIPVRGAMACGDLYADKDNNVFFGKALIDAYQFGENQDWIGFVLAPSATNQMAAVGIPADERLDYAYWNIPYKKADDSLPRSLPAYIIGGSVQINGRNPCLDKLVEMKGKLVDDRIIRKYDNTISFIGAKRAIMIRS